MKVAVVGTGYVGLVTGTVLADIGNDVICIDNDEQKVAGLKKGISPIYEPGLEEMISRNYATGRLKFSMDIAAATRFADIVFIAVGTPPLPSGETDLSFVMTVAKAIAPNIDRYKVIVNKSTVPVGTGDRVEQTIRENLSDPEQKFDVVSNPEFLREGTAIEDTMHPDRIVIGAKAREAAVHLLQLYVPLEAPILVTALRSAEVIKYASNSFLAVKISYANMIANFCEEVGADIKEVTENMGLDKRIGRSFLNAGIGYGGSCFPKDVKSLIHVGREYDCPLELLEAAESVNYAQAPHFVRRIEEKMGSLNGKSIGILGLAFKPNTDDMREAPSIKLAKLLLERGASVKGYDPVAAERAAEVMPAEFNICDSVSDATSDIDAVVVATEWNEFKAIDFAELLGRMKDNFFFDGRNMHEPAEMRKQGFRYFCVGREGTR